MKQFTYTIKDELGVHARPAGLLVKLAKKYASKVTITVTVEGEDETVAAEEIAAFLNENV